jgi:hypothetical protein
MKKIRSLVIEVVDGCDNLLVGKKVEIVACGRGTIGCHSKYIGLIGFVGKGLCFSGTKPAIGGNADVLYLHLIAGDKLKIIK